MTTVKAMDDAGALSSIINRKTTETAPLRLLQDFVLSLDRKELVYVFVDRPCCIVRRLNNQTNCPPSTQSHDSDVPENDYRD